MARNSNPYEMSPPVRQELLLLEREQRAYAFRRRLVRARGWHETPAQSAALSQQGGRR